ncbi:cobalt ECF transporter T component CbiQ [Thermochromatium tepidum]|uniref:Cobalt ECF transporter T component CbiQ n=1 Tax=Thermochromatium tepidum ATCC 43061 TaxID=316276 RepID=A0A6I6EBJ0_THETI|nr:cobalt ECF transporter T component CbiQ [Thermochromatium tepidum]QGU32309.1 cobalt ECF transporter T component CbiQ [Thermochromatium tepidum ATCC 43061]
MTATPIPDIKGSGWIVARDPRLRVIAVLAFALITVGLDHVISTSSALGLALGLALAAGLKARDLVRRLLALEGFMLIVLLTLPFTVPGQPWFDLGSLSASRAGRDLALMILFKANAVVLALITLVGTLDPVVLGQALGRLGVPDKLTHLLLMTARQIHLVHAEFVRLRQAMRARAFVPRTDWHTWRVYGWLMGMLLVRSLARAERVMDAMRCRGFHGRLYRLDTPRWRTGDTLGALGLALLLGALVWLDQS